jgi:hypothetical protein
MKLMDMLERNATDIVVTGENNGEESLVVHLYSKDVAVGLARDWLAIPDIKELIELGSSLPGGEKLRRVIELASREVREKGSRSITIPGTSISMSIHVDRYCRVELRAWRRDENEALRLIEELRKAGLHPSIYVERGYYVISIMHTKIRDSPLREPVCQKLSKWLNEASDERRKERITKAIQNLKCLDQ